MSTRFETCAVVIREGVSGDADPCAALTNAWIDATDWVPRVHAPAEIARVYREHVFPTCRVLVAEREGVIRGHVAVDGEGVVASFYVDAASRGQGIGGALLDAAKARHGGGLTLWTFAENVGARRFYARHGFVEAGGSEGENDEGLADVMLTWRER